MLLVSGVVRSSLRALALGAGGRGTSKLALRRDFFFFNFNISSCYLAL